MREQAVEMTFSTACLLVGQRLGVLEIGGVETFDEPAVDLGQHRARLVAAIRIA